MSPLVEEGREGISLPLYFSVDLDNPSDFDVERFDGLAKRISLPQDGMSLLKYVVVSDVIYLFAEDLSGTGFQHSQLYDFLKYNLHLEGKLQSAGRAVVDFGGLGGVSRVVSSGASTLEKVGLKKEESKKYAKEIMIPKLAPHFTLSNF